MHQLIGYAHNSELLGALRHLQLEGIAFQLLALQLHALTKAGRRAQPLQLSSSMPIEDVHQMLLSNLNNPPTLSELAKAAGISPRHLNSLLKRRTARLRSSYCVTNVSTPHGKSWNRRTCYLSRYHIGSATSTSPTSSGRSRCALEPRRGGYREQLEGDV